MQLKLPRDLVFDGRIEEINKIIAVYSKEGIEDYRVRQEVGGFFRAEKEGGYHTTCVSGMESCQLAINHLAHQVDKNWNEKTHQVFEIERVEPTLDAPILTSWIEVLRTIMATYQSIDGYNLYTNLSHTQKWLIHHSGQLHQYNKEFCGIHLQLNWQIGGQLREDVIVISAPTLKALMNQTQEFERQLKRSFDYVSHTKALPPGHYPVVLSPQSTGMLIHECFGHLREADFGWDSPEFTEMATMPSLATEPLQPIIKSDIPCVYDDGRLEGWGYTPVDDEGEFAKGVLLYQQGAAGSLQGTVQGKMHTQATARKAGAQPTGNGRAVDFTFEPLARMTNTYLTAGFELFETLLKQAEGGVYIEYVREGNGQSLFSLTPGRCWRIREGKIAEPVSVNLVTGTVETIMDAIKGRSDTFELHGMVKGGCGKLDQFPLDVGFGGPHTYVEGLVLR